MENDKIFLGKIKEIHQYKLILSLPHNKTGICQLNNISEQYQKLIDKMTKEDEMEDSDESMSPLSEIFSVGQTVHAKMLKSANSKINVSLIPSDINGGINLKHIKTGMKIQVAIQSREDKGYILETGIKGLNGFLPFNKCSNSEFKIGQILEASPIDLDSTKIKEGHSRVVNFSTVNSKLKTSILTSSTAIEFPCILPGMLLKVHLKLASDGNLEGNFHGFSITIKPDHQMLDQMESAEQIVAVIVVDCALKQFDCSLLPHLQPPFDGAIELLKAKIGHSEPNCIVTKVQKHQTTFSIPSFKFVRATISKEHLDTEYKSVKVGDRLTIRYLELNLVDNIIHATSLKKLLALAYFSVHQAKLGEIINCTVKGFKKDGYAVRISSQLSGFIPKYHLSDKDTRLPALAYKSGDIVRCRVFHIDHDKNKLILTVKKSFMNSTLPVVDTIDNFQPGMMLDGFVAQVGKFGLLVVMFNNLKGWVRKSQIPDGEHIDLTVSFQYGKPVQVRFLRCDKSKGRIDLSMLLNGEDEQKGNEEKPKNIVTVDIGQVFQCIVKKTMKNGFNVRLLPTNKPAFLTFEQLSDSREHRALLKSHFSTCESKEIKTNVVVINTDNDAVFVSRKHSLISAATDGRMLTKNHEITVDSQWIGWIIRKETFGIFVELPTGVIGLVPNKNISNRKPIGGEWKDLLEEGDTVEAKIVEFDSTKPKKSLFTLKMSETYKAKEHMETGALDFLANHLEERKFIKSLAPCEKVAKLEIGKLVDIKVTSQLNWGFTLSVGDVVPGFVKNQHLPAAPLTVNSVHKAVIIDIDLAQQSVEVCMTGSVVNAVNNKKNHCTKIELKQHIKSDVLAFNNDFVVAMLLDHAHGNVVFIPTKRFWNDVSKEFCWIVNQRNRTVIKRSLSSETFIGSLSINEAIDSDEKCPIKKPLSIDLGSFRNLAKKIHLVTGEQYPVYFHSISKNKIFFHISKRQKAFCDMINYSESLEEFNQLVLSPPAINSLMTRKFTVTNTGKAESRMASGHFLNKEIIEEGDKLCGLVIAVTKMKTCTVKLPFDGQGVVENCGHVMPKVRSVVQCKVEKIKEAGAKSRYVLSVIPVNNYVEITELVSERMDTNDDNEDEEMVVDDNEKEPSLKLTKKIEKSKKRYEITGDGMPEIVISTKNKVTDEATLSNLYKRLHNGADDNEELEDLNDVAKPTKTKRQKVHGSQAERELLIRETEKRRETGDILKNPLNETEFELLAFNFPNSASTWTRYMDFILSKEQNVDKARSIAERAIKTLNPTDIENRFIVMIKYIDLEIDELAKNTEADDRDHQLKKFQQLFERCLTQKAKAFYVQTCEKLRAKQLYDLAERISKRFVKDYHHEVVAWFQLVLVRFEQKKFVVVKETLTNAERLLKAEQYRELLMKMAQVEIETGNKNRAVQSLQSLIDARPKDMVLRKRCSEILAKADLLDQLKNSNEDEL